MRTNVEHQALAAAAITAVAWGLTGIFIRLLPSHSPLVITAGRLAIALAVALAILGLSAELREGLRAVWRRPVAYALAALLTAYYLLATAAFQMAPVAEVALLLSTPTLFVLAFRTLRKDLPTRREIAGALIALGGIATVMAPRLQTSAAHGPHLAGDALALCAAVLTASYAFLSRVQAEKGNPLDSGGTSVLTFLFGSVLLGILSAMRPGESAWTWPKDVADWLPWLGLGVLSTAIPTLGYAWASRRLPATASATISLFIPLFAGFFAWLILDDALSPQFVAGCIMVLGGVAMIIGQGGRSRLCRSG